MFYQHTPALYVRLCIPTYSSNPTTLNYGRNRASGPPVIPPNARHYARGVGPTGGRRTSNGIASSNGPCRPRPFRLRHPHLCSGPTESVDGGTRNGVAFPFYGGENGEGCDTLPPPPALYMWGGRRLVLASHQGGGSQRDRKDGRAGHPEPGPYAGPDILFPGLWR